MQFRVFVHLGPKAFEIEAPDESTARMRAEDEAAATLSGWPIVAVSVYGPTLRGPVLRTMNGHHEPDVVGVPGLTEWTRDQEVEP